MSKRRVPSSQRRASGSAVGGPKAGSAVSGVKPARAKVANENRRAAGSARATPPDPKNQRFIRFLGLSISGGKADKACLAVVDYYPESHRVFLNRIFDRIKAEEFISADHKVHELILQFSENAQSLGMDVPMSLPVCVRCELPCPGYESCAVPQIKWMRAIYQESDKRKPKKMFTPYTQRPLDLWLQENMDEGIDVQHTLGANLAPLVARAHFIRRRLALDVFEAHPRIAVWRLGLQLKISRNHLKAYRNSVGGDEARRLFLAAMSEQMKIFFYHHDQKLMTENFHAFESFICAYTGYLRYGNQTQKRPADFPKNEVWAELPREPESSK